MLMYLVRHGESVYNAEGRIQGQSDPELSAVGRRQSHAAAAALSGKRIERVYASPLKRARQTAEIVADAVGAELEYDPRLMEIHAGVFQDQLREQIARRFPQEADRWRSEDPDFRIPGGESRRDLMRRGHAAFCEIRETGLAQVAVVAHGGLLAAAIKSLLGIPAEQNPIDLLNGSISVLDWDETLKLPSLNDTSHLTAAEGELTTRGGDL